MKRIELAPKNCLHCGTQFDRTSCRQVSDFKEKKYCSKKCAFENKKGNNHHSYKPLTERIKENIKIDDNGCWIWTGYKRWAKSRMVYGALKVNGKHMLAHRASYEAFKEPIPVGLSACHKCDVPLCVNPEHIFLGTTEDNMKDMASKFRGTHGEKGVHSKLTASQVLSIRAMAGTKYHREIAKEFNVSTVTITQILNRKYWKHI